MSDCQIRLVPTSCVALLGLNVAKVDCRVALSSVCLVGVLFIFFCYTLECCLAHMLYYGFQINELLNSVQRSYAANRRVICARHMFRLKNCL